MVFILIDKLMPSSDLLVAGHFLLAITIITAYLITSDGTARSKQLAIRQGRATVSGIIHTCTYILYLRNEDTYYTCHFVDRSTHHYNYCWWMVNSLILMTTTNLIKLINRQIFMLALIIQVCYVTIINFWEMLSHCNVDIWLWTVSCDQVEQFTYCITRIFGGHFNMVVWRIT